MSILDRLIGLLTGKTPDSLENLVAAEMCPNCWGMQEYANEYREVLKERYKDARDNKAFVEKFVETHLTGIRLKRQEDKLVCEKCDGVYKISPTNAN